MLTYPEAWYTDNTPTNDAQVAAHFSSKRPILGMCLKRYSMLPNGKAVRLGTFVDIPTEIGLPHFIQDDSMDAEGPIYGNFKLSLQAIVCHRGTSVDSGHYIAIVRGTSAGAAPASSHGSDDNASNSPRYWMRFDDLAKERVTLVDIEQALKHESPYLLFYQILPVDEDAAVANFPTKVPSEETSEEIHDMDPAVMRNLNLSPADGRDTDRPEGSCPHRPSFEITGPDNAEHMPSDPNERKQSVAFSDPSNPTGGLSVYTASSSSPQLGPREEDGGRNSNSFSRHGSKVTKSNPGSRAGSQTSENRISATFSRFTGRLSRDKISNDGFSLDGDDELPTGHDSAAHSGEKSAPSSFESKERLSWRLRDTGKNREKSKEKPREKIGRKLERECVVM